MRNFDNRMIKMGFLTLQSDLTNDPVKEEVI